MPAAVRWLPIKLAPKDKNPILAQSSLPEDYRVIYWDEKSGWVDLVTGEHGGPAWYKPTHYLPIPKRTGVLG